MSDAARPPPVVGRLMPGRADTIADVPGVTVGHTTLDDGDIQTGVTVVQPHGGDLFTSKVPAAAAVINGFGKSVGLLQIDELGLLESPIALTNTFSVSAMAAAQIRQACRRHPEIGRSLPTVNPLVFECNDGYLNDIRAMAVTAEHYDRACANAAASFAQGSVGAGRGMSAFGLKGGIGSASRMATVDGADYTVGALVLANFGKLSMLTVAGMALGEMLARRPAGTAAPSVSPPERGSIIMVLATNAPLDNRQLHRVARRAAAGLARTGSNYGHGSGDIALAFTTAFTVPHHAPRAATNGGAAADATADTAPPRCLHFAAVDPLFDAAAEAVEQSILHALWHAESVTGRDGHRRQCLPDLLQQTFPDWRHHLAACSTRRSD